MSFADGTDIIDIQDLSKFVEEQFNILAPTMEPEHLQEFYADLPSNHDGTSNASSSITNDPLSPLLSPRDGWASPPMSPTGFTDPSFEAHHYALELSQSAANQQRDRSLTEQQSLQISAERPASYSLSPSSPLSSDSILVTSTSPSPSLHTNLSIQFEYLFSYD